MIAATSNECLGFAVDCGVLFKGAGAVIAGVVLFILSVYVLLAAIFGRWLGYLVTMVAFSGWMILLSSFWLFGFWAQGPDTPTNLGPRGSEAAWLVTSAGTTAESDRDEAYASYPEAPWHVPDPANEDEAGDIQSVQGAATVFMAEQANEELGYEHSDLQALTPTQFTVDSMHFADAEDGTPLAVVQAHFTGGGPLTTISMYYDSGSVERYSVMFLAASLILFLIHLPLLDRAERRRREFLIGGAAPPWYGPA